MIYGITIFIPSIAAAFWLRYLAQRHNSGMLLWFFFGLVGGLISVAIYYLIRIMKNQKHKPGDKRGLVFN